MKILVATIWPYPHTGGISSHMSLLLRTLERKGHEAFVVSLSQGDLSAFLDRRVLRYVTAGQPPSSPSAQASLSLDASIPVTYEVEKMWLSYMIEDQLARVPCDIVHCHDVLSCLAATHVCMQKRIPLVLTVHGYLAREAVSAGAIRAETWEESYLEGNEREAYGTAHAIATVDTALAQHVAHFLRTAGRHPGEEGRDGNLPSKIRVIHNAPDLDKFVPRPALRSAARKALEFSSEDFVLLCPRRLTQKNGVRYAVPALKVLRERNPHRNIVLIYAGDGDERPIIEQEAHALGLKDSVAILGSVEHDKMPWLYAASDAVLIPSVFSAGVMEATSIALLEALASAVPVVASAIGGIAEIVTDGVTGFLVPERDPEAIANAVQHILDEPEHARTVAERASAYVKVNHSPDKWWRQVEELYQIAMLANAQQGATSTSVQLA